MAKTEVFDSRFNLLGEGPTATGAKNELITWVDIHGKAVKWRNALTGETGEFLTDEHVGFQIATKSGGHILGTVNGPILRAADGSTKTLITREICDGYNPKQIVRWNDAKVGPTGDLFLGTMAYDFNPNVGAFYQMNSTGTHLRRLFGDVTISNGMDWNTAGTLMYYADTVLKRLDVFDVVERDIINRRTLAHFDESLGLPDGLCTDANDNIWIAFHGGGAIRCIDHTSGKIIDQVEIPCPDVTSCVFGGENLGQMFITSYGEIADRQTYPEAGMIHVATPGVKGKKTNLFGA